MKSKEKRAFTAITGDSCKQLIALSECACQIQLDLVSRMSDDVQPVKDKLLVMHPPQEKMIDDYDDKALDVQGPIRFIMVGLVFFEMAGEKKFLFLSEWFVKNDT